MKRARFKFGPVLFRKQLRDLAGRKLSILAIGLIMTIGVGGLVTFSSVYRDLDRARAEYYRDYRLYDFGVDLKRAPERAVRLAEEIPNVKSAQGRVAIGALIDLPHLTEPLGGLVLSLPETPRPVINDVVLKRGTWFSGRDDREAILNDEFAKANGLKPGDRFKVLLLDRQHEVPIVGTAMSPEFVYLIPSDGGFAPDPARFAVIYMEEEFLQQSSDLDGAFNQIVGQVFDPSPEEIARTLELMEDALDPWGVTNAYAAEDTPSVRFLRDELTGLRASSRIMPGIFLGVALLVMNVLMNRMVAQQRSIVGVLKAQGVSTAAIARHYLAAGAFIGAIGGLGGIALTLSIQGPYTSLYAQFYKIEFLRARFYPDLHLLGVGISALFASAGALKAALRAARLQPALAMRPPEPERGGRIFIERAAFVWNRLSFSWRLVLRAVFRNPFRSGVSLIAVLLSTSLIVTAFNMVDSLDYLMEYQFKVLQREDVTVTLRDPRGVGGPHELAGAAGMALVEPQLNVICDLVNGARSKRLSVSGLPRDHTLFNPMDEKGRPISIPAEGLVLGKKTAEVLGVEVGDTVSLRPLIGERKTVEAPVVGIAEVFFGLAAYADIAYLSRLLGEEWAANSLLADRFGEGDWEATYAELKERPTVVAVTRRERAFEQMESTFGETQGMMIGIMVLFAGLIAFGSVLNTALVSLSEREREVGTFRVLGFTPGEVAAILRGEQAFLSVFGIALGLWGGVLLSHLISAAYNTELYRFPVVIRGWRLVQASLLMAGFIAAAQLLIRRFIGRIDWLDAIKINE